MINLSDQLQKLINQNLVTKETLSINQKNVSRLNAMLNSYMKENQERFENIINDSFISKKSKNSFEYGLDLRTSGLENDFKQNLEFSEKFD